MSASLPFTKMQGAGNDYVYINGFTVNVSDPHDLARAVSNRHFGIGSDGLVLILPSTKADLRMRMFNADGSEAEMCGNASRCVAKYAWDHGLIKADKLSLETLAGIKILRLILENGKVQAVTVDMGEPLLLPQAIPVDFAGGGDMVVHAPIEAAGMTWFFTAVSMGNPHAVLFVSNVKELDLPVIGPAFENHPWFPKRTNTEFVEILDRSHILMRVWERGAGETLACGTGACAAVVACALNNLTDRKVDVELSGGRLEISWDKDNNHVYMTGEAVTVFDGVFFLPANTPEDASDHDK